MFLHTHALFFLCDVCFVLWKLILNYIPYLFHHVYINFAIIRYAPFAPFLVIIVNNYILQLFMLLQLIVFDLLIKITFSTIDNMMIQYLIIDCLRLNVEDQDYLRFFHSFSSD